MLFSKLNGFLVNFSHISSKVTFCGAILIDIYHNLTNCFVNSYGLAPGI